MTRHRRHTPTARLARELGAAEAIRERARRTINTAREVVSETVEILARVQDTVARSRPRRGAW